MSEEEMAAPDGAAEAAPAAAGGLLSEIMEATQLAPDEDGYELAKKGVAAFIADILKPGRTIDKVDKGLVDTMIAGIDQKLSAQLDVVMHDDGFQKLESTWRGLKKLVDNTDFRENISVEVISVSKDALLEDFEDAPDIAQSGLFIKAYSDEYGTFGGEPYGAIISDYSFDNSGPDINLLAKVASVSTMAHAPFFGSASAQFFGLDSFEDMGKLKDLETIFEGPKYAKWQGFRKSDDSRSVGLCAPRTMLRLPYGDGGEKVKSFDYQEDVVGKHDNYLWGTSAYDLAGCVHRSFANYRWCPNIIGPTSGGSVPDLPIHTYEAMGETQTKCPTEVLLTERAEFEMSEEGFIGLSMRKGAADACFFSANSCQKKKTFGDTEEGKAAQMNYGLGTQLPYFFIVNRLAHYIKVLQREQLGSWKEKEDLDRELNKWISQYVAAMENPSPAVRNQRPLRAAKITVEDVPGEAGWYRVGMQVQPHFKFMGASFELSLVGKLDK
ncbi:MAG: type VI secretion system contractile sheath large subunit [Planctomycetes bacterium]|nr:type VI secretion system contractile sheath large subunit [Planctomycetota bacterium]